MIESVIRAISPSLPLRSYLEGRTDLDIYRLKKLIRSHYDEKSASDLYFQLGSASQRQNEKGTDFVLRLMDLKQRILFASQEVGAEVKYELPVVQSTFLRAIKSGLTNTVMKTEMLETLKDTADICDEDILQRLSEVQALETERQRKLGSRPKVKVNSAQENGVSTAVPVEAPTNQINHVDAPTVREPPWRAEIKAIQSQIASLMECSAKLHDADRRNNHDKPQNRCGGCPNCRKKGFGDTCDHCFRCGSSEHYKRGCKQGRKTNSQQQGN